jgi:DnaK suppressor protein
MPVELPANYVPNEKEEYMNPKQIAYFKKQLMDWKIELIGESQKTLEELKNENWSEPDPADRASLETEAGVELKTRNRYLKLIEKIDAALRRIESGDYGYCEETGDPIGVRRLMARPIATLTVEAQERHERMEKQYSDEE